MSELEEIQNLKDKIYRLEEELKLRRALDDEKLSCGHNAYFLRMNEATNTSSCTLCKIKVLEKSLRQIYILMLKQQLPRPLSEEAIVSAVMLSIPNNLKNQVTVKEIEEISKILSPIGKKR